MINVRDLKNAVKISHNFTEVAKRLNKNGVPNIKRQCVKHNIDTSHFTEKINIISKNCPVCNKIITGVPSFVNSRATCSYGCANKLFRTGRGNGNWKENRYQTTCFVDHKRECVVCGEFNIVEVHHFDENHENNSPDNLVPLCPTHHQYFHSRFKHLVVDKITDYINNFKRRFA